MELLRNANDQNRTILVIWSNTTPTTFGIITTYENIKRRSTSAVQALLIAELYFKWGTTKFVYSTNQITEWLGTIREQLQNSKEIIIWFSNNYLLAVYPEPGSNRHDIAIIGVWDQRVYRFRHPGMTVLSWKNRVCKCRDLFSICKFWTDKNGCRGFSAVVTVASQVYGGVVLRR